MRLSKQHWILITPALLAQCAWLLGMFEATSLMRELQAEYGFWHRTGLAFWFTQVGALALAHFCLSTWGLVTTKQALWWVPCVAAAWSLWAYANQVSVAFGYFESLSTDPGFVNQALRTPGFRHFWLLPVSEAVIAATLVFRATRLLGRGRARSLTGACS